MYSFMPGCYSFREEIKMFLVWFKSQTEDLLFKIYELDSKLHG